MPRRFRRWGNFRGGGGWGGGWKKKKSRYGSSYNNFSRQARAPTYGPSTSALPTISLSQAIRDLTDDTVDMATVAMGDDDLDHEVLFGTMRGNIVGIRYYTGEVNNNEMVSLVREPHNPYDSNAVRVDNVMGVQVGHIKRELARPLASIVDQGLARVEGVVPHGALNIFTMPVDLSFWGRPERREETVKKLNHHGYKIKPPAGTGGSGNNKGGGGREGGAGPSFMDRVLASAVQLTQAEMKNELDKLFEEIQETDQTAVAEPCESIQTPLFPHQKQALAWMSRRENSSELPPFWEERANNKFFNTVTNFTSTRRPQSVRGGILADDMGLGKTLVVISLILSNFHNGKPLALPEEGAAIKTKGKSIKARKGGGRSSNKKRTKTGRKEKFVVESDSEEDDTDTECEDSVSEESDSDSPVSDSEVVAMTGAEDPEYAPKMKLTRAKTAPPVVSPNIRSRPSRSTRKPVRYTFSSGEEEDNYDNDSYCESPRKKAKTSSAVADKIQKKASKSKTKGESKAKGKGKSQKKSKGKSQGSQDVVDLTAVSQEGPDSQAVVISDDEDELPDLPSLDGTKPNKANSGKGTSSKSTVQYAPTGEGRTQVDGPRPTLVVCPLSVLSNWIDQFEEHVHPNVDLHIYTYYGPDRTKDHKVLEQQDVVLTTYQMIAMDAKGKGGPLQKVQWLRVVLDEGHTIRNPAALQSKAAFALKSERTWVLTGTPIQNSMKDLWSIICFLKVEPFTDRQWWRRTIERPIGLGDQSALQRLQKLMGNLAMRRTKTQEVDGKPLVELPPRTVYIQHVEMSADEREVYDAMAGEGKVVVGRYFREGSVLTHYADVLAILLRLRQLCCHPALVARALGALTEAATCSSGTSEELREKLVSVLKAVLGSGGDEECCVCLDSLRLPVITHCAHVFCRDCICTVIRNERPNAHCPLCRGDIAAEQLVEVPPDEEGEGGRESQEGPWQSSTKVDALLQCLTKVRKEDPSVKSLVVSQFTSFLSLMEHPLREAGFTFVRLDGSMSQQKRTDAIAQFHEEGPDSPSIMLLSLKAGGLGLNLKAASRVFLLDPAWNPASEEQCFDRCHRLGQTKEVIITKFIMKDSVEERMLELQDKKRKLMEGAFSKKESNEQRRQARINDIKTLMNF